MEETLYAALNIRRAKKFNQIGARKLAPLRSAHARLFAGLPDRKSGDGNHHNYKNNAEPQRHAIPRFFDVAFPIVRRFWRDEFIAHCSVLGVRRARVAIILNSASERAWATS